MAGRLVISGGSMRPATTCRRGRVRRRSPGGGRTHGLPPKSANRDLPTRIAPWRRRPDRRDRRFRRARLPRRLASRRFLDQRRPRRPAQADLQVVNRSLAAPRTRAGRSPSTTRSPAWTAGPGPVRLAAAWSPRPVRDDCRPVLRAGQVHERARRRRGGRVLPGPTSAIAYHGTPGRGGRAPSAGVRGDRLSRPPGRPAPPRSSPTSAGRRTVAAARAGR